MSQPQRDIPDFATSDMISLRIFLDKFEKHGFTATYIALIQKARQDGLAGATVLEGIEGFGQNGNLLHDTPWSLSNNSEVIIQIVDTPQKIRDFLDGIEPWLNQAVITIQPVQVVRNRPFPS